MDLAILDFSKAFDVLSHDKLMIKLEHYGIRGHTRRWIKPFLAGRSQHVVVDGEKSDPGKVTSGVPQGSVLGPVLFLIFVNDIVSDIDSSIRLFADDCLLYRTVDNDDDRQAFQQDLTKLTEWAKKWQMSFNVDKCYVMHLTSPRRKPTVTNYVMDGKILSQVNTNPYLGVTISRDMSWSPHIATICAKANKLLGFLKRNLRRCPQELKEKAYTTLVRPKLEYASAIWDPHLQKDVKKLEAVQRKAAHFVTNQPHQRTADEHASVNEMLCQLGWPALESRREDARVTTMYKMVNKLICIPPEYHPSYIEGSTRGSSQRHFQEVRCHTDAFKFATIPRTIRDYKKIPLDVRLSPSVEAFKANLH